MPRPSSVIATSTTPTNPVPINWRGGPGTFAVSIGCVHTGSSTYKVQHTFDNIFDSTVTPTWFDHASITGKTTSSDGNYAYPIRAVRLNCTTFASGSVTMTVLEAY